MSARKETQKQGIPEAAWKSQENGNNETETIFTKNGSATKTLAMVVDEIPYEVKIEPFTFNEERRYYVGVNGGSDHVFTWDTEASAWRAIDDNAAELPDSIEQAISLKLQSNPL
jgi:hypothetical protein